MVIKVRENFARFTNERVSEGEAPELIVLRLKVPLNHDQAGSDRANGSNDEAERVAVESA